MRKIKQIYPINLKRRQDKLVAYFGAMHTSFTPFELIKPFPAHDGADYADAFEVREAAQKEFPFWSKLTDEWIQAGHLGRGTLCCLWSMLSVLKMISEDPDKNDLSFLCTDGVPFTKKWFDLKVYIEQIPVDFNIFQVWSWSRASHPYAPHFPDRIPYFDQISRGLAGAGDALFLTPEGASRILQWASDDPWHNIETLIFEKARENPPSCISAVDSYEWVRPHMDFQGYFGRIDSERTRLDRTENSD